MGKITVASNLDARLEVFAIGGNIDSLRHVWQLGPRPYNDSRWSAFEQGPFNLGAVTVGQNRDGRLEAFATGNDEVGHNWQTAPNNGWYSWNQLGHGSPISQVAVAKNQDGRLEVFAIDTHGSVLHMWQTPPIPYTQWSDNWTFLGGGYQMSQIAVGQNADGRLEVFAADNHGSVFHMWQLTPGGGWSPNWEPLGSGYQIRQIAVGQNQDGRLEVFAVDDAGSVLHVWQTPPYPYTHWSPGWTFLGGGVTFSPITPLAVAQNLDDHEGRWEPSTLEVFAVSNNLSAFHIWQTAPNGGWSEWQPLGSGHAILELAVGASYDGRLEVFAIDNGFDVQVLLQIFQLPTGGWSEWTILRSFGLTDAPPPTEPPPSPSPAP